MFFSGSISVWYLEIKCYTLCPCEYSNTKHSVFILAGLVPRKEIQAHGEGRAGACAAFWGEGHGPPKADAALAEALKRRCLHGTHVFSATWRDRYSANGEAASIYSYSAGSSVKDM